MYAMEGIFSCIADIFVIVAFCYFALVSFFLKPIVFSGR